MVKKIFLLVSMVVAHAGCSGGGNTQAAIPQSSSVGVNGYYASNCAADEEGFSGASAYGSSTDVVCIPSRTLALYGQPYHRHGKGLICHDDGEQRCGGKAICQPFEDRNYGFCATR
jgi:hypothetical protein